MASEVLFMIFILTCVNGQHSDLDGDYCRGRLPVECCPGRNDECSVPILGTLCYCDIFCNRTSNADCCPDFWRHCVKLPPPIPRRCFRGGQGYLLGDGYRENCNLCTCHKLTNGRYDFVCDNSPCLIRPELIKDINRSNFGWKASNYSFLWKRTLKEGIKYRLGTFPPTRSTSEMPEIHMSTSTVLPISFDSRLKWITWLQSVRDQGECGASWAFSSAALMSDRLAVVSGGIWRVDMSPQLLISCHSRGQDGCDGGHLDRAWWFLRKHGTSSERCYPYHSGLTSKSGVCGIKRLRKRGSKIPKVRCVDGEEDNMYLSTPAYRLSPKEEVIMQEIYHNGPVQATFRVKEDFYSYRSGIYKYTNLSRNLPPSYREEGWHSVRIIGWGESFSGEVSEKYWLCANSWGSDWGEDGYFRIVRGRNECDIESFVIGVWPNLEELGDKRIIGIQNRRVHFN